MNVVELGATPGGWSQYARNKLGANGRLLAMDILPMEPLQGVEFIQGDFTEARVLDELLAALAGQTVDLVISDMAPNITGIAPSDQAKSVYLAELALDFADKVLKPGGQLLTKTFQGEGFPELRQAMLSRFKTVISRKPKASRPQSREIYLLGKDFLGS
jgi:23S rRNA (uridine2552-2'-O)-methyltransferase